MNVRGASRGDEFLEKRSSGHEINKRQQLEFARLTVRFAPVTAGGERAGVIADLVPGTTRLSWIPAEWANLTIAEEASLTRDGIPSNVRSGAWARATPKRNQQTARDVRQIAFREVAREHNEAAASIARVPRPSKAPREAVSMVRKFAIFLGEAEQTTVEKEVGVQGLKPATFFPTELLARHDR